jgi:hypothetical protein
MVWVFFLCLENGGIMQDTISYEEHNNYVQFLENKHKLIVQSLKANIAKELKDKIKLELLGLEDIADLCDKNIAEKIDRRIVNIRKSLDV